jgi:hypothetical protein
MYLDNYETEVDKLLKTQFHKDNYKRLYKMLATYYNLLKKIVNLKSVIYKKEAQRKWYKRDGKTEDDNYAELIGMSNIDTIMQTTNILTNVNNTSLVRIIPDIENDVINYSAVPSELVSVTQNPEKPTEIQSLIHQVVIQDSYTKLSLFSGNPKADITEREGYVYRYFYWDKERYVILDADLKEVPQESNPDNVNPYGIIPYVLFSNMSSISGSIWNETVNNDLYKGTLQVNVLQTYLNNALKLTGYRQPYITGVDSEEMKKFDERASDGLQPLATSNERANFGSFELTGSVVELRDTIHDIVSEIADNHGVSFSSRTASAQKQSGLSLSIEQEQIDNMREEQLPLYRNSENDLAEKTVIIANQDLKSNIDIEGSFSIDFHEEKQSLSTKDKIEQDKFYLNTNLKSIVDLYKEIDPDVENDDEAKKRLDENKAINDEYKDSLNLMEIEDDGTEDTE